MRHSSLLRFGGGAANAAVVLYVLVGVTHFMLPRAQLRGAGCVSAAFFQSLSQGALIFSLHYWIVACASLVAIAVYVGFLSLLRQHLTGLLCWAAIVGFVGAALSAIDFVYVGVEAPRLARVFSSASADGQSLLALGGVPHIDPCFLAFGLMGVFALVSNSAAVRHSLLPPVLGYIGISGGLTNVLVCVGALLRSPWLVDLSVALGGLAIGPVWYFWMGFVLRKAGRPDPPATSTA
jgi:hypothetical protein